ncbi:MAG: 50S ribosomal protein L18 [Opitutales bacterium]
MKLNTKNTLRQRRRWRIRKKIRGSAERPRLAVYFSNKHVYAQCIDDVKGHTMAYATTVAGKDGNHKPNAEGAAELGRRIGEKAAAAGIQSVVFDRAGRRYHGCVKAFADAARESGLKF